MSKIIDPTTCRTDAEVKAWAAQQTLLQPIREAYFNLVAPTTHWKDRIDAVVPNGISLDTIKDAVVHFTGTVPTFTPVAAGYRVQAIGYRAGPCGDH